MDSLTHAIEVVVLRQLGDEFNKLVLVDQHATPGIVKNISSRFAHNRKGEAGIVAPAELKVDVLRLRLGDTLLRQVDELWRQNVMSNIAAVQMQRLDVDVQTMSVLDVDGQVESLNVGTKNLLVKFHPANVAVVTRP